MIAQILCPSCRAKLNVSEKALGHEVPCPACGKRFRVPEQLPAASSSSSADGAGGPTGAVPPPVPSAHAPGGVSPRMPPIPGEQLRPGPFDQGPAGFAGMSASSAASSPDMPTESPAELPPQPPASPQPPHRSFWLVFIVFSWIFWGISCVVGGFFLSFGGGLLLGLGELLGLVGAASRSSPMKGEIGETVIKSTELAARIGAELLGALGFLVSVLGICILTVCYGLWSNRNWGLLGARILSILVVVLAAVFLVFSIITGYGIVVSLLNLGLGIWVMVYLFGYHGAIQDRFRRYYHQLRSRTVNPTWPESRF